MTLVYNKEKVNKILKFKIYNRGLSNGRVQNLLYLSLWLANNNQV